MYGLQVATTLIFFQLAICTVTAFVLLTELTLRIRTVDNLNQQLLIEKTRLFQTADIYPLRTSSAALNYTEAYRYVTAEQQPSEAKSVCGG